MPFAAQRRTKGIIEKSAPMWYLFGYVPDIRNNADLYD